MAAAGIGTGAPGAGNVQPGIPVIASLTVLDLGRTLRVKFGAALNGHTHYEIGIWGPRNPPPDTPSILDMFPGEGAGQDLPGSRTWTRDVDLSKLAGQEGVEGVVSVRVRSHIGSTVGRWSGLKAIKVSVPGESTPIPPIPPIPPAQPPQPSQPSQPHQPPVESPVEPPVPPATSSAYRVFMIRVHTTPGSTAGPEIKEVAPEKWNTV